MEYTFGGSFGLSSLNGDINCHYSIIREITI